MYSYYNKGRIFIFLINILMKVIKAFVYISIKFCFAYLRTKLYILHHRLDITCIPIQGFYSYSYLITNHFLPQQVIFLPLTSCVIIRAMQKFVCRSPPAHQLYFSIFFYYLQIITRSMTTFQIYLIEKMKSPMYPLNNIRFF